MAGFRDRPRQDAPGPGGGDVVVTVTATEVRDAAGRPVAQAASPTAQVPPGELRKERAGLARSYQELRGDLGGLLIEMARRDYFNFNLLRLRAAEAVAVEQRAREIDGALTLQAARGGRALEAAPGRSCPCGAATLPQDANFCAYCGKPVA